MSIAHIKVQCSDGRMYDDPHWRSSEFFICFDDRDPPEVVIAKPKNLTHKEAVKLAKNALAFFGFNAEIIESSYNGAASRFLPKDPTSTRVTPRSFRPAFSFFLRLKGPPPPPPGVNNG